MRHLTGSLAYLNPLIFPEHNVLVGGLWNDHGVSVEKGIARRLGLALGDQLTFTIYGTDITLPISSVREVDWQSLRANFYFIFPKGTLSAFPLSYMTSFFLPDSLKKRYFFDY